MFIYVLVENVYIYIYVFVGHHARKIEFKIFMYVFVHHQTSKIDS